MVKRKAFISFDYDHDLEIKNALVAQSEHPDSPFEIIDLSIKEAIDEKWKEYARNRIRKCDVVIIMCGEYTHMARGVAAELTITQEERKPYFLLQGRKGKTCTKPTSSKTADKIYPWTWDNLEKLLAGQR